jgi:hypothetical protein
MRNYIKYLSLAAFVVLLIVAACNKKEYSFGKISTPENLAINTTIQGVADATPNGDGSGNVTINATSTGAIAYKIYFDANDSVVSSSGSVTHTFTTLGTNDYTIVVNAIGTGGAISTMTKKITVYYLFQIAAAIDSALTNGSSKTWMAAKDTVGHFGVGPTTTFTPDYYKAQPNEKPACAYDGVITFTHVSENNISMSVNNQGSSFIIGASTGFYGQTGNADGCYPVQTSLHTLTFGIDQFAGSNASNSTGVQITVPGNGLINFGTGGNTYEILFLSPNVMVLRNIGVDGNAWYQTLKAN